MTSAISETAPGQTVLFYVSIWWQTMIENSSSAWVTTCDLIDASNPCTVILQVWHWRKSPMDPKGPDFNGAKLKRRWCYVRSITRFATVDKKSLPSRLPITYSKKFSFWSSFKRDYTATARPARTRTAALRLIFIFIIIDPIINLT